MIVIYDSGMGGLTVLDAFLNCLPQQNYLYIGDTDYCPYGNKTPEQIMQRVNWIIENKVQTRNDVSLLVLACNTVSALCKEELSQRLPYPVMGTIEAAVEMVRASSTRKKVGLLATQATVNSKAYEIEWGKYEVNQMHAVACPKFAGIMEHSVLRQSEKEAALVEDLKGRLLMLKDKVDSIIYGCTHYPMLEPLIKHIESEVGWEWLQGVIRVNPANQMALNAMGVVREKENGEVYWCITGNEERFMHNARSWLPDRYWLEESVML
ncbi:glutamate racemase [Bacillus cereus]|uniref:Glutamate racemase n=1 Tax=Bacillus cereus TaxID=1396 RepID=A0A162PIN8_BACCE|nr:glutamate racemase [Bacillus cereus]KZD72145.1 Glutamate racemase [Bacillus cereus]